jgi:HD-GYP domain-containing protein (c-di-GMP phosphodiesterase class II)
MPYHVTQSRTAPKPVTSPAQEKAVQGIITNRTKALTEIENEPTFNSGPARRLVESSLDLSFGLYFQPTFTSFVHDLLKIATKVTLKIIGQQPPLPLLLSNIHRNEQDPSAAAEHYTASHSLLLAEVSCAIAGKIGWNSEPTYSKLILAAFLHDIALGNHGMAKFQRMEEVKKANCFTEEEIEEYRMHPERASQYARELIGAPSELEIMLAQHHEQADGKGFPGKITQQHLNPLTCLLILAHELLNFFLENGVKKGAEETRWEHWLKISHEKYEGGNFLKILKHLGDENRVI